MHPLAWCPHSGATLLEHFIGTHDILRNWDVPEGTALAGLFHSAYGGRGAEHSLWNECDRDKIRSVIGAEAESLVWQYSRTSLSEIMVGGESKLQNGREQLLYLFLANFVDQHLRQPQVIRDGDRLLLISCLKYIKPLAESHVRAALGSSITPSG
jgi:hypothetical protein